MIVVKGVLRSQGVGVNCGQSKTECHFIAGKKLFSLAHFQEYLTTNQNKTKLKCISQSNLQSKQTPPTTLETVAIAAPHTVEANEE